MKIIKAQLAAIFLLFHTSAIFAQENEKNIISYEIGYSAKIFQNVSVTDATVGTQVVVRKIIDKTGLAIKTTTQIYNDTETIVEALNYKGLDLIALLPEDYLRIRSAVAIEPYLIAEVRGNIFDEFILLARAGDGITQLSDLADKRIQIYAGVEGDLPGIWLDVLLMRAKLPQYQKFFSEVKKTQTESQAALPVFFDQADAAIITQIGFNTLVELNPQIGQKLKILTTSPGYANGLFCINRHQGPGHNRNRLAKAMCELHLTPEGKQMLTLFKVSRFHLFKDADLENIISLLNEYELLVSGQRRNKN